MGDCSNDTLMITNLDPNSQGVVPADLCGDLTGTTGELVVAIVF